MPCGQLWQPPTVARDGDHIQMLTSLSAHDYSWNPDKVLRVGQDVSAEFASALVSDPPDTPRAKVLEKREAERLLADEQRELAEAERPANEIPPPRSEPPPAKRAIAPDAETRETAVQKRTRQKPKPPDDADADAGAGAA